MTRPPYPPALADLADRLPDHLRERLHPIAARPLPPDGELVLYWMHHAVRGHEHPALDAALLAAEALGLPLLVYQGLGGRYPFNADRHHRFILEGAVDAHAELAARGVRAVFHLPADPAAPSPLRELAARAALVITEDFPAPPMPAWTAALAARIAAPVWALDCACLVPLRSQPQRFERAFEFRRHNANAFAERAPRPWPAVTARPAAYDGPLPFTPLALPGPDASDHDQAETLLDQWIADCAIDHSIPPIPGTRGGARAGYARWATFREQRLRQYHRRRNDATDWDGVSRLSAWLHHGQVSPFRIAREAAATGGEGARKFLDELLIWRELAHNFCAFTADPEALTALPDWAQETLAAHADDPRPLLIDADRLAHARTGDALWDLSQRSLLVHGELHNNLRMTWAKAILPWTPSPAAALATLIALNHRYALDGADANSYGGLLWALGLYDRPFPPARPVSGLLRERTTTDHAKRIDLAALARRIEQPTTGRPLRIAVIGAGIAGLAAARMLTEHGHQVRVFEKSRGPGGRAATRRLTDASAGADIGTDIGTSGEAASSTASADDAMAGIDHGAQYFTARHPGFQRLVEGLAARGVVAPWTAPLAAYDGTGFQAVENDPTDRADLRWVGVPGMNAIGRELAAGLDLVRETTVAAPRRLADDRADDQDGGWSLSDHDGANLGRFDQVLITAPAPQAAALLTAAPALAEAAAAVRYAPCWTVLLGLTEPVELPYAGVFVNSGALRWAAHNGSKPGRHGHTWVLQATPAWSRDHIDAEPAAVIDALIAALTDLTGAPLPRLRWSQAQRWLYSLAETPLRADCLWDPTLGIGAAGDWCNAPRIEGAWRSGIALAARVLASAARHARRVG